MKEVGLYFGSFNPIHIGHLIVAHGMLQNSSIDEIWFVVSPQNPFKQRQDLLDGHHRLEMVRRATADNSRLHVCDVEFCLPMPSYTARTLSHLSDQFPDDRFCIIMGSDNLATFDRWHDWERILNDHHIYCYPRKGFKDFPIISHPHVTMIPTPTVDISSTYIRQQILAGKDVRYLMPDPAYSYLVEKHFYEGMNKS